MQNAQASKDVRRLKLSANAQARDLVIGHARQVMAMKLDAAGSRPGLAGDDVQQRGFAGAVGTDDHAQFPALHGKIETVECRKTAELDRQVFNRKNRLGLDRGI